MSQVPGGGAVSHHHHEHDADAAELASPGYHPDFKRDLGLWANVALGFTYLSAGWSRRSRWRGKSPAT